MELFAKKGDDPEQMLLRVRVDGSSPSQTTGTTKARALELGGKTFFEGPADETPQDATARGEARCEDRGWRPGRAVNTR